MLIFTPTAATAGLSVDAHVKRHAVASSRIRFASSA